MAMSLQLTSRPLWLRSAGLPWRRATGRFWPKPSQRELNLKRQKRYLRRLAQKQQSNSLAFSAVRTGGEIPQGARACSWYPSTVVTSARAVDLTVQIGAVRLRNPILAASGTFGYGVEFAHLVDLNSLGGIVVKGLSLEPMAGAPPPRLCETPSGMLNAIGLQNIGVRAFVAEKLPALRSYRTAVIANVFGCTVEEYVGVIRILEEAEGLAAYELNISCPNTTHGGLQFGSDPQMVSEVVAAARGAAKRP